MFPPEPFGECTQQPCYPLPQSSIAACDGDCPKFLNGLKRDVLADQNSSLCKTKARIVMASVFKRGRDKNRRGACWYISYDDESGKRRTKKRATEQFAGELEQNVRRRKSGLIDPEEERRRDANACSIDALLDEFEKSLRNNSPKHIHLTMG